MSPKSVIEEADRKSRMRAIGFGIATVVFVLVQVGSRPVFGDPINASGWRMYTWALNVAVLLACIGTGGGLINSRQVRALVNDEVARSNYRKACGYGFWTAMLVGLVLFVVPQFRTFSGPEAIYLVVTPATVLAVLTFCWLEFRAHADA